MCALHIFLFIYFSLKIDQNYVGNPPPIEVTITNLNDNIDKQFLSRMLEKCGLYDDIIIYHHPTTNKHLGVARIVFENIKAARQCVEKYNQKSVMGKVMFISCKSVKNKYLRCIFKNVTLLKICIYTGFVQLSDDCQDCCSRI